MIIILAVLPIFLLFIISTLADITAPLVYNEVEGVTFVNADTNATMENGEIVVLEEGTSKKVLYQVLPTIADNQKVTVKSNETQICTVELMNEGEVWITGVAVGVTEVFITTEEGGKTAKLTVQVRGNPNVTSVVLSETELTLTVGDSKTISATVQGPSATNRNVLFTSLTPAVAKVTPNGKITAVSEGTAMILVTTMEGGFTATCTVTVLPGNPALSFDFSSEPLIMQTGNGYFSQITEINLPNFLVYDENRVNPENVKYVISSGSASGSLDENNVLTLTKTGIVRILAYVGEKENPTYSTEIRISLPWE